MPIKLVYADKVMARQPIDNDLEFNMTWTVGSPSTWKYSSLVTSVLSSLLSGGKIGRSTFLADQLTIIVNY